MIPKIAILVNLIIKALKINKNTYIVIIYKYTDTIYLMIDNLRIIAALTTTSTAISELLSLI